MSPQRRAGWSLVAVTVLQVLIGVDAVPGQAGPAVPPALARPAWHVTPAPKRPHPHRKPWPITLTVQTVPVLAGVRLRFDDQTAATDVHGRVTFTREHAFATHSLRLLDVRLSAPGKRLRFVRWAGQRDPGQAFRSTVTGLPMRANYTMTAGFAVQREVVTSLVDEKHRPVAAGRVSAVVLRSANGGVVNVPASGRLWLDAVVPVYRDSTIAMQDQTYSLTSVMVAGTNTVDAGRQKFQPDRTPAPVFHAKFFDLTVTAHDLLLKDPAGAAARVTFPDGTVHTVRFGAHGRATVPNLPRGIYDVTLDGGGTPVPTQLVLSRNTIVDLPVATPRDLGILILAGSSLALGLLGIGRGRAGILRFGRRIRKSLRRQRNLVSA